MRVVSLLPSTTEILVALGLEPGEELVGRSVDCDWPPSVRTLPVVSASTLATSGGPAAIDAAVRETLDGGTSLYRLDEEALGTLRPDLIVTQDLCAVCAVDVATVDEAVAYLGCDAKVVTIDPGSLDGVLHSILVLGDATGRGAQAAALVATLRDRLDAVRIATSGRPPSNVLVLEWTDPPFGAGHWVPDLVGAAGGRPLLARRGARSVELAWEEIGRVAADVVVVAPCGFHLDGAVELARALLDGARLPGGARVVAVDADAAFVRPGPRLVDGVEGLAAALHPGAVVERPELVRYVGTTSAKTNPSRSTT